jgi:hypothetical protein
MGPRAGLDDVKKRKSLTLPGLEFQLLGGPVRSQSLYRFIKKNVINKKSVPNTKGYFSVVKPAVLNSPDA